MKQSQKYSKTSENKSILLANYYTTQDTLEKYMVVNGAAVLIDSSKEDGIGETVVNSNLFVFTSH